MTVRETSAISHAQNCHDSKKHRIRVFVRENSPCTRRQIAVGLGYDTATVSGMVTPMLKGDFLNEAFTGHCPITGRKAIFLESPVEQLNLI